MKDLEKKSVAFDRTAMRKARKIRVINGLRPNGPAEKLTGQAAGRLIGGGGGYYLIICYLT